MPIHLIWGDDIAASEREITKLINELIDPAWKNINLSRLDGTNSLQVNQALTEARTPPFGNGARLILLKQSPICNNCSNEIAKSFEDLLELIPKNTHLILVNTNKPDGRLKTTKTLQKLIKNKQATEKNYTLPTAWDGAGQRDLVIRTASDLNLELEPEAISFLIEAIGNDSSRLSSELKKLALHAETNKQKISEKNHLLITLKTAQALIDGMATNALEIGNSLLNEEIGDAIARLDSLLDSGEPALRILATLTGQIRGWLWVSLLELQGERNVSVIAEAAGIGNPKRIYIMRKQLKGRPPKQFLNLLSRMLEIEASLKKGVLPKDAFRDGLINQN